MPSVTIASGRSSIVTWTRGSEVLAMITDGRLDLRELIAERIPLQEAGAAMMAMGNLVAPRAGITVAVPDAGG